MSAASFQLRFERKFVPDTLSLAEVHALVRRHPAGFREAFPPRTVNNLYLDTPGRRHYHDHVQGLSNRVKIRLRWYGLEPEPGGQAALELKFRHGLLTRKEAYPAPNGAAASGRAWHSHDTPHAGNGWPATVRQQLASLEPALINRYQRRYFLSADQQVRLTVDSELEFFPPRNPASRQRPATPGTPRIILELKYSEPAAEQASQVANRFPFRLTRCSKYVLGIERLGRY
jgi:hypothetical protein